MPIVATYWSHESHSLGGEKDAVYAMSDKDGLRRFCASVFQNKLLSEKLQRAATQAKPGKPSRGGQFTAEQRTWAQNILRRKLWKSAPCPIDCETKLFFSPRFPRSQIDTRIDTKAIPFWYINTHKIILSPDRFYFQFDKSHVASPPRSQPHRSLSCSSQT